MHVYFFVHKKKKFGYVAIYLRNFTCYITNATSTMLLEYGPARNGSYANFWTYTVHNLKL